MPGCWIAQLLHGLVQALVCGIKAIPRAKAANSASFFMDFALCRTGKAYPKSGEARSRYVFFSRCAHGDATTGGIVPPICSFRQLPARPAWSSVWVGPYELVITDTTMPGAHYAALRRSR
jgi:hypothetical protein